MTTIPEGWTKPDAANSTVSSGGWGGPDPATIKDPAIKQRAAQHPDKPWLWREDWASGRVHSSGPSDGRLSAGLGLVIVGVAVAAGLVIAWSPSTTPMMIIVTTLLAIAGLMVTAAGVRQMRQSARVGSPVLVLETLPIWIGGRLRGQVEWPWRDAPASGFTAEVRAVPMYRDSEVFGRRSTGGTFLFTRSSEIGASQVQLTTGGYVVPLDCEVPRDQPGTGVRVIVGSTHGVAVGWELAVRPRDAPGDAEGVFKLPVFAPKRR